MAWSRPLHPIQRTNAQASSNVWVGPKTEIGITTLPTHRIGTLAIGTRAKSDGELVRSSGDSLRSAHSRRNFEKTALRFLEALPAGGIRKATVDLQYRS